MPIREDEGSDGYRGKTFLLPEKLLKGDCGFLGIGERTKAVDLEFTSSKVVKKRTTGAATDVSHTTARPLEMVIRPIIVEETVVGVGA